MKGDGAHERSVGHSAEHAIEEWKLPSKGVVGMACLIIAEAAIFIIFVVAYLYYVGKSLSGPTPSEVLEIPIFHQHLPALEQHHGALRSLFPAQGRHVRSMCSLWLATRRCCWAASFSRATGMEWYKLITSTTT